MTGKSREVMDGIGMIEQDPVIQTFGLGDVIGHRLNDSPPSLTKKRMSQSFSYSNPASHSVVIAITPGSAKKAQFADLEFRRL